MIWVSCHGGYNPELVSVCAADGDWLAAHASGLFPCAVSLDLSGPVKSRVHSCLSDFAGRVYFSVFESCCRRGLFYFARSDSSVFPITTTTTTTTTTTPRP